MTQNTKQAKGRRIPRNMTAALALLALATLVVPVGFAATLPAATLPVQPPVTLPPATVPPVPSGSVGPLPNPTSLIPGGVPGVGGCVPSSGCTPEGSYQGGGSRNFFALTCPAPNGAPIDAFLGAGTGNFVGAHRAGLVAGTSNTITCDAPRSYIGAGDSNWIETPDSSILGGRRNLALNNPPGPTNTGGGALSRSSNSVIGGGTDHVLMGAQNSAILAGIANNITASWAGIAAGAFNVVSMDLGFVGGGNGNRLVGIPQGSTIYGCGNFVPSVDTLVQGMPTSSVSVGCASFIGAGTNNLITRSSSAIGAGRNNVIDDKGDQSIIGGGVGNRVRGPMSGIVAGQNNVVFSSMGGIAAGNNNAVLGLASFVGGGSNHNVTGDYAGILSGVRNTVAGEAAAIAGGSQNTISVTGLAGAIGGGVGNTVAGQYAIVGAGQLNSALGRASVVGAGLRNAAIGDASAIGAGQNNMAHGNANFIGAGANNTVLGAFAAIGAGSGNRAGGHYSVVGGGLSNTALGLGSTVLGGARNSALADFSTVAGGVDAVADVYGQQAFSSGGFTPVGSLPNAPTVPGTAQRSIFVSRGQVVAAAGPVSQELFTDGESAQITIRPRTTWTYDTLCTAADPSGQTKAWRITGVVTNAPTGNPLNPGLVRLVGIQANNVLGGDPSTSLWGCNVDVDQTTNSLRITGSAPVSANFVATTTTAEVTF